MPDAFLTGWIRVRVVRAEDFAVGSAYLMLAATFFAIVAVLMQREAVVASADVGADCVAALLLAAAIVQGAFVFV